jgi:hypothetical protein
MPVNIINFLSFMQATAISCYNQLLINDILWFVHLKNNTSVEVQTPLPLLSRELTHGQLSLLTEFKKRATVFDLLFLDQPLFGQSLQNRCNFIHRLLYIFRLNPPPGDTFKGIPGIWIFQKIIQYLFRDIFLSFIHEKKQSNKPLAKVLEVSP